MQELKAAHFVDHGRTLIKAEWTSHGPQIKATSEIWFAAMEG
jgi:hypothetical protein